MPEDRLQQQRYEFKYLIPERIAGPVRDFVQSFLDPDEYGATQPNLSYPIHSLYLDSDDFRLYASTINGDKNRYKLRLRYYDDRAEAPVYFEIKHRLDNTIYKQRGGVRREAVPRLIAGQLPEPAHLLSKDPRQLVALQRFSRLMHDFRARPKAHVAYLREAWTERRDNTVRVTLDRQVSWEPEATCRLGLNMTQPLLVFGAEVVLELKFTDRFPGWFRDLVQTFGLTGSGAAKYVDGLTRFGVDRARRVLEAVSMESQVDSDPGLRAFRRGRSILN